MLPHNPDIISKLRKEILGLQGYKLSYDKPEGIPNLGPMNAAFPNQKFPLTTIHEFVSSGPESFSASSSFIAALLSTIMPANGLVVWASPYQNIFPPGLKCFNIEPDRIIFLHAQKEKDRLWLIEEALKCEGLSAVVGEISPLNFTSSRRFQLAIERSRVTGIIINSNRTYPLPARRSGGGTGGYKPNTPSDRVIRAGINNTSGVRWRITSLPSNTRLPGIGFPKWNVELLKVKNGKVGTWRVTWNGFTFDVSHLTAQSRPALPGTPFIKSA